jgi:DDE superfamily endonuclease
MVPVYQGVDQLSAKYDNFNFYASQCRIRVEMAFGMMQSKWGILQRPLNCSMRNMLWMVQAIARLHNYCINERVSRLQPSFEVSDNSIPGYIPAVPHDIDGDPVCLEHDAAFISTVDGHSFLREWMATRVEKKHLERPGTNGGSASRKRRREEQDLELVVDLDTEECLVEASVI